MATATIIDIDFGLRTKRLYGKSKSGRIYCLNGSERLSDAGYIALVEKIKAAGKINLQHWTKVK